MDQMTYESVADRLNERLANGEITLEEANRLNDAAYERYLAYAGAEEDTALEGVMSEIQDFITEKCKVLNGETVIGADKNSDAKGTPYDTVGRRAYTADPSNVNAEPGLGSKRLASDIDSLIDLGDSQRESVMEAVEEELRALRLKIYEAFEEGYIDEDDKFAMLDAIDVNNYDFEG